MNEIRLPRLKPELYKSTLAQALKIQEEAGELAQKIGLLTGATGERKETPPDIIEQVAEEALDVAQSACGVLFALQENYKKETGFSLEIQLDLHFFKMKERGYLEVKK